MSIVEKFIPQYPLNTPVLFLVFNRLDTTKQVFEAIRQAKPPKLYVAADGAREEKKREEQKVKAVREYIMNNIDWNCEVKTLFRDENLGCKYAVSGSINWFFENEEMGIILEDDCLPSQSFFWFCEELLQKYKNNKKIGMISGDNFQRGIKRGEADYYFSVYNHIWGWASWADRWVNYDVEIGNIDSNKFIKELFADKKVVKYWTDILKSMKNKCIDTWDYQWTFTLWNNKQLSILPNTNLISNIGFGEDATHTTKDSEFSRMVAYELILRKHPSIIRKNLEADEFTSSYMFIKKTILERIVNKIKRFFK
ncbi:nucleotide-diphospho-sugar transferase [Francisella philomiragia]|uniref:nucleotide-diphospho-sugar transferase n=1 Tax=Francisella philomiragia TaxID=28110 RepID=UPI0035137760